MNIECWSKLVAPGGMYTEPDSLPIVITGIIYGHPTIKDGEQVVIRDILGWDHREAAFVDANHSEYRLKDANPAYEAMFPKCSEKILKAAKDRKFNLPNSYFKRE